MHMADALLSPAVGGSLWAATAGAIACCARAVKTEVDDRKVPLMGVLGAFIFAVQMINFTIPGTGSSGHLGGGMILAILLGPAAALIAIASVLTVQALFFADGGLLALGCNIFNLGILPCFVAYPLVYKKIAGKSPSHRRIVGASILAAAAGLQLGAFAVVLETALSGISELPFRSFVAVMLPVHLGIGLVEGGVTAAVVGFIRKVQPEALPEADGTRMAVAVVGARVLLGFLLAAMLAGGVLSWFASTRPDGLEWAVAKVSGGPEPAVPENGVHSALAGLQRRTALFPDYGFKGDESAREVADEARAASGIEAGTTVSGLVGGLLTLVVAVVVGLMLKKRSRPL
jgi:cobalt/nickel transport system permease protein